MELKKILGESGYFNLEQDIMTAIGLAILYAEDIKDGRRIGSWSELSTDVASTIMAKVDKAIVIAEEEAE